MVMVYPQGIVFAFAKLTLLSFYSNGPLMASTKSSFKRSVVVGQLTEQSFLTPEDPSSNPIFEKILVRIFLLWTVCSEKMKINKNGVFWGAEFFISSTKGP